MAATLITEAFVRGTICSSFAVVVVNNVYIVRVHCLLPPQQNCCRLFLATNLLAVAVPTNPSHPMTSSTTSASRYGPLKFWLLSNS